MTEKRFSIKGGSSIGLSSIYADNGKVMTQLEVLDVLIKQHETIQTLTKENEQLKREIGKQQEEIEILSEENEELKSRFHRERELAMRLSRECDALTIKKQELGLEIIRLEEIIKTGKR